jgi:hypothetical protein
MTTKAILKFNLRIAKLKSRQWSESMTTIRRNLVPDLDTLTKTFKGER